MGAEKLLFQVNQDQRLTYHEFTLVRDLLLVKFPLLTGLKKTLTTI